MPSCNRNITLGTERNRRIGVGLFGVQEWAATHSVKWSEIPESDKLRHFIQDMAQIVAEECESYAHELRIPCPIKSTTVAQICVNWFGNRYYIIDLLTSKNKVGVNVLYLVPSDSDTCSMYVKLHVCVM